MAFRRRKKQHVDDTRQVIDESEANRKRLIELAAQLCVYVDDLRDLTVRLQKQHQQHEGTARGG